jgi:hypothetical protein
VAKDLGLRTDIDDRDETVGKKIRDAGGVIHTSSPAEGIVVQDGKAVAVRAGGNAAGARAGDDGI